MLTIKFIEYFFFLFLVGVFFFFFSVYLYMYKLIYLLDWIIFELNSMKFNYIFYIDFMSMMYLSTVILITSIVMIYSIDYMANDLYINRFILLVLLFMLSMCLMIFSPCILSILLGWDGLGLISYCLVIYYQNKISYNSGMLTVCCNRIGDISLILMICILSCFGSWNLLFYKSKYILWIFIFIMMITKSAQLPFSLWLPAAMTAPTPVSSLVHSSTLVTAGVYLLIRFNYLFMEFSVNKYLLMVFSLTMFMSGLLANFEMNFKKIIALSTLSQLGFMMSILSMGLVDLGFFHLIMHAFFKSMMFMSVGGLIHMNLSIQDLRMYGMMIFMSPMKSLLLILSILNLCGFPFISGFFSKDLILEGFLNMNYNMLILFILYLSIIMTLSYSIRLLYYVLFSSNNFFSNLIMGEFYIYMNFVFFFLMFFSNFFGLYFNLLFIDSGFLMSKLNKILILKMYIFSAYLVMVFLMLDYKKFNNLIKFFISMFYLLFFMKVLYVKLFELIFKYEAQFEKTLEKIYCFNFFLLLMSYSKLFNYKTLKYNFNIIMLMNVYLYTLLIFFYL
uniref:NADH:ubiquinone reductase (H(+)-translocating) n=1 Tax=Nomia chalybeata TaxID=2448184 RepID=A0A7L8EYR2_9HYME|nr:NADH dehydrogenase subunit 5 [Nomia chalybeata]QOE17506.1 NADH dehydrogenase subunit 5 [Nomia chalybeata]